MRKVELPKRQSLSAEWGWDGSLPTRLLDEMPRHQHASATTRERQRKHTRARRRKAGARGTKYAALPKIRMADIPEDGIIPASLCNKNGEVIVLDLERGAAVIPASEVQALQRKEPLDRKEEK